MLALSRGNPNQIANVENVPTKYVLDVLWCQLIKLIQVVSTSEFHEY